MKKNLQLVILCLLGLGISYQIYVFFNPDQPDRPLLPTIPLTLLDQSKTTITEIGKDQHTIVFIMSSNCDFCKKETRLVREKLDEFKDTQVVFVSFEETEVIAKYKQSMLPEERSYLTFAKANLQDVEPFLEHDLVFPYMLWYDNNGIQKAQHRGLFPIERILEVIEQQS